MKQDTVTATKKIDGVEYAAAVSFEIPESCDEMKEAWGDQVGVTNGVASAKVTLQSGIRRRIVKQVKEAKEAGVEPKINEQSIKTELANYKPGEATPKQDPIEAMLGKFQSLPEGKQAELLKELKQKAKGK